MKQQDLHVPLCDKCSLESGSLFKHLTTEEVDKLNYEKDFRQYKRGDILYQEGNRISGFFCINGGIIKVFKTGLDDQQFLNISITREELANLVGTATESVIRLLSEFKSDKLVELNGRKIKILNTKRLDKISNVFN